MSEKSLGCLAVDLGLAGVEVAPDPHHPDRIRHRPKPLPPDLIGWVRIHKAELLRLLRAETPFADDAEADEVFRERIATCKGEGMPTHVGSSAWLLAVGETLLVMALRADAERGGGCQEATEGVP